MKWVPVLTLVFFFSFGTALAANATEALEEATVNIYCSYATGNKTYSSTGTGVFISSRGVILTNAHVVQPFLITYNKRTQGSCTIRTGSPARDAYTAELLYLSPEWVEQNVAELRKDEPKGTGEGDFALLYVTGATEGILPTSFPALTLSSGFPFVTEDEEVIAGGYPAQGLSFTKVRKNLARKTATSTITSVRYFERPWQDVLTLSPSTVGAPGVSGGPVVRSTGELLGIVTAIESGKTKENRAIRAITVPYINRLLLSAGTSLSGILSGDLKTRAAITSTALTPELHKEVTSALFKRR